MTLDLFNAVPAIEILYDEQGQPWIHRSKYWKLLNLPQIYKSIQDEMKQHEVRTRAQLPDAFEGQKRFYPDQVCEVEG